MTTILVPLSRVTANPWQTRQGDPDPAYLKELALDIAHNGLLQTPTGRLVGMPESVAHSDPIAILAKFADVSVQLAFGHNRLAAFAWLNSLKDNSDITGDYSVIPVEIGPFTDEQMADFAWSENEKRRDHTPLERALAIQKRMENFGWNQEQIAAHLGISRPVVSNALALLELPEDIQQMLHTGELAERQAQAILALFKLPESLRTRAESHWNHDTSPSYILTAALNGASSESIRSSIDMLLRTFCTDLKEAIWEPDQYVGAFPKCHGCPNRVANRNVCMDISCFNQKGAAVRTDYLQRASQASGIAILEGDKSAYEATQFDYGETAQALPIILSAGCENLRLAYERRNPNHIRTDQNNILPGFVNATIVCTKRRGFCTCANGHKYIQEQQRVGQQATQAAQEAAWRYDDDEAIVDNDGKEDEDQSTAAADTAEPGAAGQPTTAADLEAAARQARSEKRRAAKMADCIQNVVAIRLAQALEVRDPLAWRFFAHHGLGWTEGLDRTEHLKSFTDIAYHFGELAAKKLMPLETPTLAALVARINADLAHAGLATITPEEIEQWEGAQ